MHLIVMIQESIPGPQPDTKISKFVQKVSSKNYQAEGVSPDWSKIRPRKIEFYDFIIPSSIEEEVMKDLAPYCAGKLQKLSKIANVPILKNIIEKTLKVKQVDIDKYKVMAREERGVVPSEHQIYLTILGKVEDGYTDKGVELL